jgi:hypothetical protein
MIGGHGNEKQKFVRSIFSFSVGLKAFPVLLFSVSAEGNKQSVI